MTLPLRGPAFEGPDQSPWLKCRCLRCVGPGSRRPDKRGPAASGVGVCPSGVLPPQQVVTGTPRARKALTPHPEQLGCWERGTAPLDSYAASIPRSLLLSNLCPADISLWASSRRFYPLPALPGTLVSPHHPLLAASSMDGEVVSNLKGFPIDGPQPGHPFWFLSVQAPLPGQQIPNTTTASFLRQSW